MSVFAHLFSERNGRTLVVCPASLIKQWEDEIEKFVSFPISVMLHHGDKRSTSAREIASYEIVITTYGIVKSEFEKVSVSFVFTVKRFRR